MFLVAALDWLAQLNYYANCVGQLCPELIRFVRSLGAAWPLPAAST